MKKWKLSLGTVALSLGLLFNLGSLNNVSASSWHKGTPSALRGKWRAKTFKEAGSRYFDRCVITKGRINTTEVGLGSAPSDGVTPAMWNLRYKYLGNHLYKFSGLTLGPQKANCWIKWRSHNHILIKILKGQKYDNY